ncbi:MAG: hypothetical protein GXP45_01980 [bacterium]|nr:hypothetical protein [bacterium]
MVGLTQAKPFQRIKRGTSKRKQKKALRINMKLLIRTIWIVSLVLIFVYGTSQVLKRTILAPKYTIQEVKYADKSVKTYDNPYLYKAISEQIKGKNYYRLKRFHKKKILHNIQEKYPLVYYISFEYQDPKQLIVIVDFREPQMIIKSPKRRFAIYHNYNFELFSGSSL